MDPLITLHENTDLSIAMIAAGLAGVASVGQTYITYPLEYFTN